MISFPPVMSLSVVIKILWPSGHLGSSESEGSASGSGHDLRGLGMSSKLCMRLPAEQGICLSLSLPLSLAHALSHSLR